VCGCPALGGTQDAGREWRFVLPHPKWWATRWKTLATDSETADVSVKADTRVPVSGSPSAGVRGSSRLTPSRAAPYHAPDYYAVPLAGGFERARVTLRIEETRDKRFRDPNLEVDA
jgi:hypothetical protein